MQNGFQHYPLLEGPWTTVRDEVEAQLIPIPGGTETYVLCRSTARREKELAIRRRFSTRLEDRLRALEKRVATGRLKDRAKIDAKSAQWLHAQPRAARDSAHECRNRCAPLVGCRVMFGGA